MRTVHAVVVTETAAATVIAAAGVEIRKQTDNCRDVLESEKLSVFCLNQSHTISLTPAHRHTSTHTQARAHTEALC